MFAIAAVVIVLLNRRTMLTREVAVTEVLYPGEEGLHPRGCPYDRNQLIGLRARRRSFF